MLMNFTVPTMCPYLVPEKLKPQKWLYWPRKESDVECRQKSPYSQPRSSCTSL